MAEKSVTVYEAEVADDKVAVKLKKPIKVGSEQLHEVVMREPTALDFRRTFTKKNTEKFSQQQLMMQMAAELSGLSDAEFDQLCLADMTAILEAVDRFV